MPGERHANGDRDRRIFPGADYGMAERREPQTVLAKAGLDAAAFETFVADTDHLDTTLRFASACGALAVTRAGSFAAMPASAEVEAFLEQHA